MRNNKLNKRKCTDCLHCKVCSLALKNSRICFCSKEKDKQFDLEKNWCNKSICKYFEDMCA